MTRPDRPAPRPAAAGALAGYGYAVLAVGALFLARAAASPVLGGTPTFVLFIVPTLVAAGRGGLGPGLLAALLGGLLGNVFLSPAVAGPARLAATLLFVTVASTVAWLGDRLHQARCKAQASEREAGVLAGRLAAVLESTTDGVLAADPTWRIVYVNRRAAERIAGGRELVGQDLWTAFPDLAGTVFEREYRRAVEERVPVRVEAFYPALDGWFEAHAYPSDEGLAIYLRDVTEPRRTRDALTRALHDADTERRRLRAVLDALPVAVFVSDASGRLIDASPEAARIWGGPVPLVTGVGEYTTYRAWWAETGEPLRAEDWALARALQTGETSMGEMIDIERFDGTRGTILHNARPIRDAEGRIEGGVSAMLDVTRLRQAEAALRGQEAELARRLAQLRATYDGAPVGLAFQDRDLRYLDLNERLAAINGRPIAAHLGRTTREVLPELADQVEPILRRIVHRGESVEGIEIHGATAADPLDERDWFASYQPVRGPGGTVMGVSVAVLDITARKRAERAARASEERQRFLAEAGVRLGSSLDLDATLRGLSDLVVPRLADSCAVDLLRDDGSLERVTAAHVDPRKADVAREIARRFPRRADEPWHPTGTAIRTGRSVLMPDLSALLDETAGRDGPYVGMLRAIGFRSYMVVPLVARDRVIGTVAFGRYESPRTFGPEDLALAEDLARRAALAVDNARLFREAEQARRDAEAAARARDAFLARASHELRTPLTSAVGTVRLLRPAMSGRLAERPEELVAIADRNLTSVLALVNDLLDASKLASGAERLALAPVDLAGAVRESLDLVGAQAREKGVGLEVAVPPGTRSLADPARLERVLVNLLANAVKFTPSGGTVRVEAEEVAGRVVVRVRDTGEGIRPEHLEAIFEPFFQAEGRGRSGSDAGRRTPGTRGTGLGLAICRQIVTLLGGRIWAESEGPAKGSTLLVDLPAADRPGLTAL